jgi:hypothetical protein
MTHIPLSQQGKNKGLYFALVDDEDFKRCSKLRWSFNPNGYAERRKGKTIERLHRFIMNCPKGKEVDHINGNKLDNRKCNLRICTQHQNSFNKSKQQGKYSSIYKGVCFFKRDKNWMANITKNNKYIFIGYFKEERHAAMAYDIWAKELFGKHARLNF